MLTMSAIVHVRSRSGVSWLHMVHGPRSAVDCEVMPRTKAPRGRIALDKRTHIPDGVAVHLSAVDEQNRKELDAAIEAGERELDLGNGIAADELWARLRAIPC